MFHSVRESDLIGAVQKIYVKNARVCHFSCQIFDKCIQKFLYSD